MSDNDEEVHDLSEDLKINKFRLEDECEKQPSLYYYWSRQEAEARSEVDDAVDALKVTIGRTNLNIRKGLGVPTGLKITEDATAALVTTNEDVIQAQERLRKANAVLYRLRAGVGALEHRKAELDNLTYIMNRSHYTRPAGSGPATQEAVADEQRTKLNQHGGRPTKGD